MCGSYHSVSTPPPYSPASWSWHTSEWPACWTCWNWRPPLLLLNWLRAASGGVSGHLRLCWLRLQLPGGSRTLPAFLPQRKPRRLWEMTQVRNIINNKEDRGYDHRDIIQSLCTSTATGGFIPASPQGLLIEKERPYFSILAMLLSRMYLLVCMHRIHVSASKALKARSTRSVCVCVCNCHEICPP